ncbi:MAG: class I SAM-dependent methyltransferase [Bacteroidetes bacterium]|nr:class I SAM-dependent methyltransferase [bacterium]NBP64494.1 class I SAM-dependent methyltransferase [Bacteroidota bacterium]
MAFRIPDEAYESEFPNWNHQWGGGLYKGIFCQQNKNFYPAFEKLFAEENIVRVLEVGTATGGFIRAVRDLTNAEIITYDVLQTKHKATLEDNNITVNVKSVFDDFDFVEDYISKKGQVLVLCDGGNKIKEFEVFSRILKSGDIIMAHDYSYDENLYQAYIKNHVWRWCEIQYKDIALSVAENNLEPYMTEEFQEAVWTCWKKA